MSVTEGGEAHFLDTSALVKLYHQELGSEVAEAWAVPPYALIPFEISAPFPPFYHHRTIEYRQHPKNGVELTFEERSGSPRKRERCRRLALQNVRQRNKIAPIQEQPHRLTAFA
jgi:hypothetical protein